MNIEDKERLEDITSKTSATEKELRDFIAELDSRALQLNKEGQWGASGDLYSLAEELIEPYNDLRSACVALEKQVLKLSYKVGE